jgi:hypothetical protein
MTAEQAAGNINGHIERLADEVAERYDRIHGRTEDWLNESFRRQQVRQCVRQTLHDFLLGELKDSERERSGKGASGGNTGYYNDKF